MRLFLVENGRLSVHDPESGETTKPNLEAFQKFVESQRGHTPHEVQELLDMATQELLFLQAQTRALAELAHTQVIELMRINNTGHHARRRDREANEAFLASGATTTMN